MNDPSPPLDVRHNEAASRFEAVVDGHTAFAAYDRDDDVLRINHTSVPASLEGRGIAGALVRAALDYARAQGFKVEPWCSYVRAYMKRHRDTQSLLPPDFRL
jgi:predicted GNAT family acetyltransferase